MNKKFKNSFKLSPGLFGYGKSGIPGIDGLNGISFYIANYDGGDDNTIIKNRIENNQTLLETSPTYLPGYPKRVYQTGDIIADRKGKLYYIDFSDNDNYVPIICENGAHCNLGFLNLFAEGPTQPNQPYFTKYINEFTEDKILIDQVYALDVSGTYVDDITVYDNSIIQYANIFYIDQSIADITNNYRLYDIWIPGILNMSDDNALALVRADNNTWSLGNKTGITIRNINIDFDFTNINTLNIFSNDLSSNYLSTNTLTVDNNSNLLGKVYIDKNINIGSLNNNLHSFISYSQIIIDKNSNPNTSLPENSNNINGLLLTNFEIRLNEMFGGVFELSPSSFTVIQSGLNRITISWDKVDFFKNITDSGDINAYNTTIIITKINDNNIIDFTTTEKPTIITDLNPSGNLFIENLQSGFTYQIQIEFQYSNGWMISSDPKFITI